MRRLVPLLFCLAACGDGETPDPCEGAPTYTNDIAQIVTDHCIMCHDSALQGAARNGAPAERDFDGWDNLEPHIADVADVITSGRMPPMNAPNTVPVTPPERQTVSEWRRCGYER